MSDINLCVVALSSPSFHRTTFGRRCAQTLAMRTCILQIVALLICIAPSVFAASINVIGGTYVRKSASCTASGTPNEHGEWESCAPEVVDCLSIQPLSISMARVSVLSIQVNGHRCSAEGIATLVGPSLLQISAASLGVESDGEKDFPLEVGFSSSRIKIVGPQALCGARATWGGLEFPKTSRRTKATVSCTNEAHLHRLLRAKRY